MRTGISERKPSYKYINNLCGENFLIGVEELNKTVYSVVKSTCKPEAVALICDNLRIKYKHLLWYADKIAGRLWYKGLRPGDQVLAMMGNSVHAVAFFLACSKIGVGVQCYTENTNPEIIENVIKNTDTAFFFIMQGAYTKYADNECLDLLDEVVVLPYFYDGIDPTTSDDKIPTISNIIKWDDFMCGHVADVIEVKDGLYALNIMNTSGSTGKPKGILHTNYSHVAMAKIMADLDEPWKKGEKIYSLFPIYVATGISLSMLTPLMLGMTVVLTFETDNASFVEVLEKHKPEVVLSPKSMWLNLMNCEKDLDLSCLKHLITAGEPIFEPEMNLFRQYLVKHGCLKIPDNAYGLSEFNSLITMTQGRKKELFSSAGFALPHIIITTLKIDEDRECDYNEPGEICAITPACMKKYQLNKNATREFFYKDDDNNVWGRTGDVGYVRENGEVVICCRQKEMFTDETGVSIYPFEIERIINKMPGITRSKVLKMELDGKKILAVHFSLDYKPGSQEELEEIYNKMLEAIKAENAKILPKAFKYRESFPLNKGGKMDMVGMALEQDGFFEIRE